MTTHAKRTHVASKNTSTSTKLLVLRRRRHSFVKSLQNLHHNTVMHECFLYAVLCTLLRVRILDEVDAVIFDPRKYEPRSGR